MRGASEWNEWERPFIQTNEVLLGIPADNTAQAEGGCYQYRRWPVRMQTSEAGISQIQLQGCHRETERGEKGAILQWWYYIESRLEIRVQRQNLAWSELEAEAIFLTLRSVDEQYPFIKNLEYIEQHHHTRRMPNTTGPAGPTCEENCWRSSSVMYEWGYRC